MADGDELVRLWNQLDLCDPCRHVDYAKPESKPPGRPFLHPKDGALLFIGEAPPSSDGFWKCGNRDELRSRLLPHLPGWPSLDPDTEAGLQWFVEAEYFFVQAMKWPLRDSYNQQAAASRQALQHATACHLDAEINLMNPRGIVALGAAAWDACSILSEKYGLVLADRLGVDGARLQHHEFPVRGGRNPLLPAGLANLLAEIGTGRTTTWSAPDTTAFGPATDSSRTPTEKGQRSGELGGTVGFSTQLTK